MKTKKSEENLPTIRGFSTTYFSNYKKFGKLNYYTSLTFGDGDKVQKAKVVELLVNEKISDEDFQ